MLAVGDAQEALRLARGVQQRIEWSSAAMDWGDVPQRARQALQRAQAALGGEADAERKARESEAYRLLQEEENSQNYQQEARLEAMLDSGWQRYVARDFDGASELARAVLEEDKGNEQAQELLDAARDGARETRSDEYLRDRAESFARWHEDMESVRVPTNDILTAPDKDHWAEITRLRGGGRSLGLKAGDARGGGPARAPHVGAHERGLPGHDPGAGGQQHLLLHGDPGLGGPRGAPGPGQRRRVRRT